MQRFLFWGLVGLTLSVYGLMIGWSLPTVSASAGGLAPFDMRPGGYSFGDAQAFISALSSEGAEFYRNVQQRLDIAYPALITLTLFLGLAALLRPWLGQWRWLPAAIALPIIAFDYLENHAAAKMIEAGADQLTPEIVAAASQWTVLKSNATMMTMTVLLVLIVIRSGLAIMRWRKAERLTARAQVA